MGAHAGQLSQHNLRHILVLRMLPQKVNYNIFSNRETVCVGITSRFQAALPGGVPGVVRRVLDPLERLPHLLLRAGGRVEADAGSTQFRHKELQLVAG